MAVGNGPLPRVQNDMETQIHLIEQEAYCSVLRAFKAQSDTITWVSLVITSHCKYSWSMLYDIFLFRGFLDVHVQYYYKH